MTDLPANYAAYIAAGLMLHDGGSCPVPLDSKPGVLFKDGAAKNAGQEPASFWTKGGSDWWRWQSHDPANNIVAYLPDPNYLPEPPEQPDPIATIRAAVEHIRAQLSAINGAIFIAANHHCPYTGESIADDLNAIDAALVRLEQENG